MLAALTVGGADLFGVLGFSIGADAGFVTPVLIASAMFPLIAVALSIAFLGERPGPEPDRGRGPDGDRPRARRAGRRLGVAQGGALRAVVAEVRNSYVAPRARLVDHPRVGREADPPGPLGGRVSDAAPAVSCRNVWKIYGPKADKVVGTPDADLPRGELLEKTGCVAAVRDISFDVAPGEVFVVMGLSGSGKSTLVRIDQPHPRPDRRAGPDRRRGHHGARR